MQCIVRGPCWLAYNIQCMMNGRYAVKSRYFFLFIPLSLSDHPHFNIAIMQLSSSTARTARTAGAILHGCTCGFKAGYVSPSLIHRNRMKSTSSAGPSSEIYDNGNDNTAEDYHDPAHARMLTSRLTKTKKRMVKRVCQTSLGHSDYGIHAEFYAAGPRFCGQADNTSQSW